MAGEFHSFVEFFVPFRCLQSNLNARDRYLEATIINYDLID